MTKRRNFSDKFKDAVALEALRVDKTVQEIAAIYRTDTLIDIVTVQKRIEHSSRIS